MTYPENYLQSAIKELWRYRQLGNETFVRLKEEDIHWRPNEQSNSIAIVVKHMAGNMRSRWTNFFTEDGEKEWRNRDSEFEDPYHSKEEMLKAWNEGWDLVFKTIEGIDSERFDLKIRIRNEDHTVIEAINRQLGHYAYHTGQIITIAKSILGDNWQSLTIPKGRSTEFNRTMFRK